jgi:acyl carrier protein
MKKNNAETQKENSKSNFIKEQVKEDCADFISDILELDKKNIDYDKDLLAYGFTSVYLIELANKINNKYDIELEVESIFGLEIIKITSLVDYLIKNYEDSIISHYED